MAARRPARPRTQADDDAIRAGHAAGKSLHEIAKELDRSKGRLKEWADEMGLSWDRSRTEAASIARHVDGVARRQSFVDRLYGLADKDMTRAEQAEWKTLIRGANGAQREKTLDFIPADEANAMSRAITGYVISASKLEAVDADAGLVRAKGLLTELAEEMGVLPMDGDDGAAVD